MKKLILVCCTAGMLLLAACSKDKKELTCEERMIQKFATGISCSPGRGLARMDQVLASGVYKEQTIYFLFTICPVCNTLPPTEGYTCAGEKVDIDDFGKNVSQVEIVKDCE